MLLLSAVNLIEFFERESYISFSSDRPDSKSHALQRVETRTPILAKNCFIPIFERANSI